jgi:hypothetical protein
VSHESLYLKSVPRATDKFCVSVQTDKSNYGDSDELNLPLKLSDKFNTCVLLFRDEKKIFSLCKKIQTERGNESDKNL